MYLYNGDSIGIMMMMVVIDYDTSDYDDVDEYDDDDSAINANP